MLVEDLRRSPIDDDPAAGSQCIGDPVLAPVEDFPCRAAADDLDRGFLLLTDLGIRTYLGHLDATSAPASPRPSL